VRSDKTPGDSTVLDGRYRLLRRLGSGGMAAVWVAHDERLGREVAVKILSDVLAGDESYRHRFAREARVAADLSHPGLVGILDFGAESERPYLVMELVRGDTLAQRIAAGTTRELDLLALASDLLGALGHIHARGVVHRDVKPANVLIAADGRARLTDFGIARPRDATTLTQTGQVIGTLSYMAPEVQRGEPATPRSDLYALGLVLRECDGGREPSLVPLIDRLSAGDPADRPASADEALAILTETAGAVHGPATQATERLAAREPTAVPGRAPRRRPPVSERRRRLTAGRLLAGFAALGAIALALALASGGGDEESPPGSGQPRQATEPSGASGGQAAEPGSTAPPTEPESGVAPGVTCASIEQEKKALEEEKKAAEKNAGDDQDAKEAIKAQFEAKKKAREERAKTCD
jgi:hypothetical protein